MELKRYKLSEVAKVEISSVDKKTKENETPVRLCNFTDVYHNWAITSDMASSFMEASANSSEIEKFTIKKGQVAFTKDSETRDDIGIPTYIADDFEDVILGYHCALITPDETKLCGKYLNAFMHSAYIQRYFELNATGSGMRYTLSLDTLESMPLLLPSLEEQRRIGEIFSSLDKKISINRAINQNLEAMAKQLYDYWFVQFDFPNEEGKPYKSSGGKMVWNEKLKREIPEGWDISLIKDIATTYSGGTPKSTNIEYYDNGEIAWINSGELNSPIITKTTNYITKCGLENSSAKLYPSNSILVAMYGATAGKVSLLTFEACSNQAVCGVIPTIENMLYYVYFHISSLYSHFITLSTGSARDNISQDTIKNILLPIPTRNILKLFDEKIGSIYQTIVNNYQQIDSLTKQRDELLPLLMNGQVSVNSDLAVIAIIDKFTSFTLSSGSKSRRKSISPKRIWRTGLSVL
jgi:type I restriction enzyme S subunit